MISIINYKSNMVKTKLTKSNNGYEQNILNNIMQNSRSYFQFKITSNTQNKK